MLVQELYELARRVEEEKCEGQYLKVKKAGVSTPEKVYDTLSSFSNQNGGGIMLFGLDEKAGFHISGVYDPQDIQQKITEQCEQMDPVVRPHFTVCDVDGRFVVSAEITECDIFEKPCFYRGRGRVRGSYVRVGEADKPMTEYEVYSFEVFKRKIQDELRVDGRAKPDDLNRSALSLYFAQIREKKRNLATLDENRILELQGVIQDGAPTVAGELLFGVYPQSLFPQYCITASVIPGTQIGDLGEIGERFLDDRRIEGTIPQMLEETVGFVVRNMKRRIIIDSEGRRSDRQEYPVEAIREAVLNSLIHRDYSIHTENSPIRVLIFDDRIEIENPGGLYGRGTIENLGMMGLDTRNPYIAGALEIIINSENRYSGIPVMRRVMENHRLRPPVFSSERGVFRVSLYSEMQAYGNSYGGQDKTTEQSIISYCSEPRSREELANEFRFESPTYFLKNYVKPLVEEGKIRLTLPAAPKSKNQKYVATGGYGMRDDHHEAK